jgi:hypothetical protein
MAFILFAKPPSDFARQEDNDNANKKNEKKGVIVKMSHDSTLSQQTAITDKAIQAAMLRNGPMAIVATTKGDCKVASIDLKANDARLIQAGSPFSRLRKKDHITLRQPACYRFRLRSCHSTEQTFHDQKIWSGMLWFRLNLLVSAY